MLHLCTAESPEEHAFSLLYNVMRHFVVVYYCRTYEKAVSGGREREMVPKNPGAFSPYTLGFRQEHVLVGEY